MFVPCIQDLNVKALKKYGTSRSDKIKIQYPNVTMSAVHNLANVSPLCSSLRSNTIEIICIKRDICLQIMTILAMETVR